MAINGGDTADQMVKFALDGSEIVLKVSGAAAKNLILYLTALCKDQKKTHGKTRLIRMLKEQRPLKFFDVPSDRMQEFAQESKRYGTLFVAVKDRKHPEKQEVMVFADDAAKVNRILKKLSLADVTVGDIETRVSSQLEKSENFIQAPDELEKKNPSELPLHDNEADLTGDKRKSVREELKGIRGKQSQKMQGKEVVKTVRKTVSEKVK